MTGELVNPETPRGARFPLIGVARLSSPTEWATTLDAATHIDTGTNPIRLTGEAINGPGEAPKPLTPEQRAMIIATSDQWNEGE